MANKEQDGGSLASTVDSFVLSLVSGTNSQDIAEKLGIAIKRPILIEDKFFRIIGKFLLTPDILSFPKPQLTDPYLKDFVSTVQTRKIPLVMPPLPQYGVSQARIVYPIVTGDVIHGYLHIFDKRNPPVISDEDHEIIIKVLLALSIKTLIEDAEIQTKEESFGNLYRKLIFLEYQSEKVIQETAAILSLDLSIPSWLIIAHIEGAISNVEKRKALRSFLVDRDVEATVICIQEEQFLIFIPEREKSFKKTAITALAHYLIELLNKCYPFTESYLTFGRKCLMPGDYHKSYHEALKALDYLKKLSPKGQVLSFDSLGIIGWITLPEDVEQMLSFSHLTLRSLLEHDKQNASMKLVETLECYLKNDCYLKKTAGDLYLHVNTLRYRLEKIQEIGQFNLNDAETKFQLYLAFKIINLSKTLAAKDE